MRSKDDDSSKPASATAGKAALKARRTRALRVARAHNEARLAEALRANLGRRKEQARARAQDKSDEDDKGDPRTCARGAHDKVKS